MKKNKESLWKSWHMIKQNSVLILEAPEEQWAESLFEEIMTENFPNLKREKSIQICETQRTSNRLNIKRTLPRNFKIKFSKVKDKERILSRAHGKIFRTFATWLLYYWQLEGP